MIRTPLTAPLATAYWWMADQRPGRSIPLAGAVERRFADSVARWCHDLNEAEPIDSPPRQRRVLVFTFVQRWVEMCTAIAFVLVHRNCSVDLVFVPQYWNRQTGPGTGWDRAIHERLVWRPLRGIRHPRLRAFSLEGVPRVPITAPLREELADQARTDVMYMQRKEALDLSGEDERPYLKRLARNIEVGERLASLIEKERYDSALIGNGLVLDGGAAYRTIRRSAVLPVTFEGWPGPNAIVASQGKPWSLLDVGADWAADEPHVLDQARRDRLRDLLDRRIRPQRSTRADSYQHVDDEEPASLRDRFALGDDVVVLLCTNVFWDSVFLAMTDHPFGSMSEWLVSTVRHLAGRDGVRVLVQTHPLERFWQAAETATSVLARSGLGRAPNVRILSPRDANTYSLMRVADVGSVYASTTGLEMAMCAVPVICGNRYHYAGKGFTYEPTSAQDYFAMLDSAVREPRRFRLSDRQVELAWCYADVFFHCLPKAFPWTLTSFRNDEVLDAERSMATVLSPAGQEQFGAVFDLLAGR